MNDKTPATELEIRQGEIDITLQIIKCRLIGKKFTLTVMECLATRMIELSDQIRDYNRKAIATMMMGRIMYAQGKYHESLQFHIKAAQIWKFECPEEHQNYEYVEDNLIYMLKSKVSNGVELDSIKDEAKKYSDGSDRSDIICRAWLISKGKFWNGIDTFIQSIEVFFSLS